jgi:BolA protein
MMGQLALSCNEIDSYRNHKINNGKYSGMVVQEKIELSLADRLTPLQLEVINESFMHNVPEGSETHFKVTAVSQSFNGLRKVRRHQLVYEVLKDLLAGPVHALALHLFTPDEWQEGLSAPDSPKCHGGER